MEGALSACTAFMSLASILWLVVAKLATGSGGTEAADRAEAASSTTTNSDDIDEVATVATAVASRSSSGIQTTQAPSSSSNEKTRLSRRQRRNVRRREKETSTTTGLTSSTLTSSTWSNSEASSKSQKKRIASKCYVSLGLSDDQIYYHLLNYILDQNTLRSLGFPLESQLSPGKAWVYQDPEFRGGSVNFVFDDNPGMEPGSKSASSLDVNAREFVPGTTAKQSAGSEDTEDEGACTAGSGSAASSAVKLSASAKEFVPEEYSEGRHCARCNKLFYVFKDTGECIHREECVYHWGKARSSRKFSCCRRDRANNSIIEGCVTAPSHVWRGFLYDISGQHKDLDGFAKTRVPRNRAQPTDGNYGVYGIDGEMVFTTNGLQLCKITVVGIDGRLVYETFVRPDDTIIDFNTRFSGVSLRDLKSRGSGGAAIKSLKDVQNDLLGFINANTILIGHGLENDLRALKVSLT